MYKDFKTRIKVKAEMEDAFAAFINPFTIELWSGYPAVMSSEAGSEFSLWEGDIVGRVLEVEEEKKIVQEWYFGEQNEPSIVTIKFFPQGGGKVQIDLLHTNIPEEAFEDIVEGWNDYYLGGIKTFLEVE
ncbi:SRPBCC domain-containing protein [Carboxylicivirga sediminis]|uniref:SRPBCC domain-containing protein n=1 Tax=Carboxylicivirga sediminis TaxID=2006564 RepID=A0A941F198_9BACT|nr:SRPBCC domain-containing protein [Carboxylicivirga sediminis]MBR8533965.1 SRPBCC domain-containing protein [Carboxylicivirga sediminis]